MFRQPYSTKRKTSCTSIERDLPTYPNLTIWLRPQAEVIHKKIIANPEKPSVKLCPYDRYIYMSCQISYAPEKFSEKFFLYVIDLMVTPLPLPPASVLIFFIFLSFALTSSPRASLAL